MAAQYYDYCGVEGKGDDAGNRLRSTEAAFGSSGYGAASASPNAAEFNPRANSGTGGATAPARYWPPLPAEPSLEHSTPRWWVSPAVAAPASPSTTHGASAYPRPLQDNPSTLAAEPVSCASNALNMGAGTAAPTRIDRFPADLHTSSNPYLMTSDVDPTYKSASTWRQQQQLQDWSEAPGLSSHLQQPVASARAPAAPERGVLHPVFSDQYAGAGYYNSASAIHNQLPQFGALNRPRASPLRSIYTTNMHGGSRPAFEDDQLHCWGTDHAGRLSVGKSQSMRALYEENAALRRALHSIRRGSANNFDSAVSLQSEQGLGELDRCIASDVAEGRAMSMRERGRWAMQATGDGSYPICVGTPGRQWAAGAPLHSMQAGAGAHHRRPRYQYQNQWWDQDVTAEHPLFYNGGSFGGWPELEPMCWGDMQNECSSGAADHDEGRTGVHQGTSLKQLLGGGSQKWRREGRKKGARRREVEAKRQEEEVQEGLCAMCGGRLRHVVGGKSRAVGGLPLRLCPACHPHAAASLPHSTRSPPALPPSHSHRHHVATTVLMACRPTPAQHEDIDQAKLYPSSKPLKVRSSTGGNRSILDLCRHFVGLSTK